MDTARLPVLRLTGAPRTRGRIHGEVLRAHIHEVMAAHEEFIRQYFGLDPTAYLGRFRAYGKFRAAIEHWAPDLLEEVRGIAEGAAIDFAAMLDYQLIDEEWVFGFYHERPVVPHDKCTAFAAVAGGGSSYAGQNMDVPRFLDGHQAMLHIVDEESETENYVFTYAGHIGLAGMSAAPLGLTCNALSQLQPSNRGLPVAFIVRRVLDCPTSVAAGELIRDVAHASGQSYIVSSPGAAQGFECSASKVVAFAGDGVPGRLCHTNHAFINDDQGAFRSLMECLPEQERLLFTNSKCRYASMAKRMCHSADVVNLVSVKAALSAHDDTQHPVSRTYTDTQGSHIGFTAGSLIYEYGEPARLHVAAGPPCSTAWRTFGFSGR